MSDRGMPSRTYSGGLYYPWHPVIEEVCILDIAQALSNLCRYSGQSADFFSVAEHSVLVSRIVPKDFALEGLLHDAAEAYCNDLSVPLKEGLPDYNKVLAMNERIVRLRFHLPQVESECVTEADLEIRVSELDQLFPFHDDCRAPKGTKLTIIRKLTPFDAKLEFLSRFAELAGKARL